MPDVLKTFGYFALILFTCASEIGISVQLFYVTARADLAFEDYLRLSCFVCKTSL